LAQWLRFLGVKLTSESWGVKWNSATRYAPVCQCPHCNNPWPSIFFYNKVVGISLRIPESTVYEENIFEEDRFGIFIIECTNPNCLKKFWFHVTKNLYQGFVERLKIIEKVPISA
jgi:hypothetical protein